MTECEKRELIRSMAMGVSFEEISRIYEMSMEDINAFYAENKAEINEEIKFQKIKYGGELYEIYRYFSE